MAMGDGRRLSELLQEQQEPFLPCRRRLLGLAFRHRRAAVRKRPALGLGAAVFCGSAVRRALLASCFSCGARESFRRLRRAGGIASDCDDDDDDEVECARQLSPVSVLDMDMDMHSDEESSHVLGGRKPSSASRFQLCSLQFRLSFLDTGEEDESPSTSGKSSPPPPEHGSPCLTLYEGGKNGQTETGEEYKKTRSSKLEEQVIISSWERIAGDISRIPMLVQLDLTGSARQWRRPREEEALQVGASIEAMIFEEMRVEAVHDMLL